MVMANRPEVRTAPLPIAAIDLILLAQQLGVSLARVPLRQPLHGPSNRVVNVTYALAREMLRSFMGFGSSVCIPEFRSVELTLDELCKLVAPGFLHHFNVTQRFIELGGVPGILYSTRNVRPKGMILYLHGGGYIGTSPSMYAFATARLCKQTRCAVLVVDYRLAPEFPFPASLEDASRVLVALVEDGVVRERLFVAGDSAGGGLATALVGASMHGRVPRPAGLILLSPEVDLVLDEPSILENAEHDILPWNIPTTSYLSGLDAMSPWVSAVNGNLRGFPPTALSWGGDEIFRDPIRRFAQRMKDAGVSTEAEEIAGMFHDFQILLPWSPGSKEVFAHIARFVDRVVATAPYLGPLSLLGNQNK